MSLFFFFFFLPTKLFTVWSLGEISILGFQMHREGHFLWSLMEFVIVSRCQKRDKVQTAPKELVLNSQKQVTHNQFSSSQESSFLLYLNCKCHKIKFKVSAKAYSTGSLKSVSPYSYAFVGKEICQPALQPWIAKGQVLKPQHMGQGSCKEGSALGYFLLKLL